MKIPQKFIFKHKVRGRDWPLDLIEHTDMSKLTTYVGMCVPIPLLMN